MASNDKYQLNGVSLATPPEFMGGRTETHMEKTNWLKRTGAKMRRKKKMKTSDPNRFYDGIQTLYG